MIAPGPTLETPRLILRPTATEDLEGFVSLMSDPESARFIGGVLGRQRSGVRTLHLAQVLASTEEDPA